MTKDDEKCQTILIGSRKVDVVFLSREKFDKLWAEYDRAAIVIPLGGNPEIVYFVRSAVTLTDCPCEFAQELAREGYDCIYENGECNAYYRGTRNLFWDNICSGT